MVSWKKLGVRFINGYKKTYSYPNCKSLWARRRLRSVWPGGSDIRIVSHFVAKLLGHTSAYATVWPIGSDINVFAHYVTQILGHLGFESRSPA